MSPGPDDKRPRRKKKRTGPSQRPDPAKFPFGESVRPDDDEPPGPRKGGDKAKFPFGETVDDSDEVLASPRDLDDATLKTLGLAGSTSSEALDSDLGHLIDSDLGALDQSGDVIQDTGEVEPEEVYESSSSLPSMPPGSTPDDDASLAGLDTGGDADSDEDYDPMFTPSELGRVSDMGPIGPSGPLVIVDDDAQSTRFSASVAGDDSVRMAGARSARRPGQRGKAKRKRPKPEPVQPSEDFEASWDERDMDVDVDVPTVSARKPSAKEQAPSRKASTARSGRRKRESKRSAVAAGAGPPPQRSKLPLLLLLFLVLALGGVSIGLELKRREDVKQLLEQHQAALATLRAEHETELAGTRQGLQEALNLAKGEQGQLSQRLQDVQTKLTTARESLDAAQAEQRSQREAFEEELDAKVEAERERLLRERAAALEVELAKAVEEALEEERAEVQAKIAAAVEDATAADEAELEQLRTRNRELESALEAERVARRRAEEALKRAREGGADAGGASTADDHANASGSGSSDGGGSELDSFFGDAPPATQRNDGGGSELDDFFGDSGSSGSGSGSGSGGELDDFFGSDTGDSGEQADAPQEDEPSALAEGWASFTEYVHGVLGYRHFSHFSRDGNPKTRNEAFLQLEFDHWVWFKDDRSAGLHVVADLEARADDDDLYGGSWEGVDDETSKRPYVVPNELYGGLLYESLELRVGWQRFAWGTGDLFNPTDQLNPSDYSDLFAARRIPVLSAMVNLNLQFEFGSLDLEAISIPTFNRTRVPLSGTRFDPLRGFPLTVFVPDDPAGEVQNMQWAAKVVLHAFGWDVSLSGFTGFDDLPAGQLATVVVFPPVLQVEPVFDRIHMIGSDFATTLGVLPIEGELGEFLGRVQFHGELAHTFTEGPRADDVLQYVFGINYTFVDLIGEDDMTLILEYAGEIVTQESEVTSGSNLGRVLAGAVLVRLQYVVETQQTWYLQGLNFALNVALNVNGPENAWVHPELNYTVNDTLSFQVAGDIFYGPEDTFFGQYEKDGRLVFTLRLSF